MSKTREYIDKLFHFNNISLTANKDKVFEDFIIDQETIDSVELIVENQKKLMEKWKIIESINDITNNQVQIPNGTVGKLYEYQLDFTKLNWENITFLELEGLEQVGLLYSKEEEKISGTPNLNGDFKIKLKFKVQGESENSALNEKIINLIINSDPKSLWKNIPSDSTDAFWKEDNISDFQKIGDKHIVVASKRGRSHANVGSFRDDDFSFHHFEKTGWSVVAVSDGAGSAIHSRKGSQISCDEVVNFVEINFDEELSANFDQLIINYQSEQNKEQNEAESSQVLISKFIYKTIGNCAKHVHNKLGEFANLKEFPLKDLHSTLIFTLFKKYDFGYVILSFGVGDCPIAVVNKDKSSFKLMNWLDVGEFGGGTRFITMPEIFTSDKFSTRFGFKIISDFSYLMLMTDGIYDAKFVVEANLEKLEKWLEFIADLEGDNEDSAKVLFDPSNKEIANQLSSWMDFWSPGNHDDRTLAIIF